MSETDPSCDIAKRCRPFGLLDGMLLIAAVGLWLNRLKTWIAVNTAWETRSGLSGKNETLMFSHRYYGQLVGVLTWVNAGALYCLAVVLLSGFYLCVRIRRPHPPWGQMFVQPGMIISWMLPVAFLIAHLCCDDRGQHIYIGNPFILAYRSYIMSALLACAWLGVCVMRRSTIQSGWIEWLGRLVGVGWVGIGLVNFVMLNRP